MFATKMGLWPEQASTLAEQFDWLMWFVTAVTTLTSLGVFAALAYFCVVYRRSVSPGDTPRIMGSHQLELIWTVIPLLIFLGFFAWGAKVYNYAHQAPADAEEIYVVGKRWMWKVQYQTGQRVIIGANTESLEDGDRKYVGALVLQVDKPVKLILTSEDVIHDFAVPAFRSKVDVVPGRYVQAWYHPTKIGEYHLFCDQYCGTEHSKMIGKVRVVSKADYDEWLLGTTNLQGKGPLDGSPAREGAKLFQKLQCIKCHGGESSALLAPRLEGLWGARVAIDGGGTVEADRGYIRESILYPQRKIRQGWASPSIMPAYGKNKDTPDSRDSVTEEDVINLTEYIRSLHRGETPLPLDKYPTPVNATPVSPGATKGGN